jgi:UDP-N-acetylglucosamine--N-acetylmuramyl-(pentapeptide) pyrophosphoryl-undecaprenol N-acetylglucosamine transferase
MKVVFACAGTGGHINPAIAMANIILENEPNSKVLFIGTENGLENDMVKNAGFQIKHIRNGKILRSFTLKNVKALFNAYLGIGDSKKILKDFNPDVVIGTGGYICVPVMSAAKKLKIPYILHESNAFPGISVKLLAKNASKVLIGFKDAAKRIKVKTEIVYTGTPTKFSKKDIERLDKLACLKKIGLENVNKKIVLVTCGSQGALKINNVVLEMVKKTLSEKVFVVLVTGNKNYDQIIKDKNSIEKEININLDKYIKIEKFVFNMDEMYKVADLCVTRSGALTITELAIAGKPSILIPLPYAAENHQFFNAKVLEDINAAVIIEEKDLNEDLLYNNIINIFESNKAYEMEKNIAKIANEKVSDNIYMCIKETLKK